MSVHGTETAIRALKSAILAYVPAEMTAIETEFGDALVLERPAAATVLEYAVEQHSFGDGALLIELLCDEAGVTDWQPAEVGNRMTLENAVNVRVSIANRTAEVPELLYRRVSRTVAALLRVLTLEKWTLDGAVEVARPESIAYRNLSGDLVVRQATLQLTVRTAEVNT